MTLRSPEKNQPRIRDAMLKAVEVEEMKGNKRPRPSISHEDSEPKSKPTMTMEDLAALMASNHMSITKQLEGFHTEVKLQFSALEQEVCSLRETVDVQAQKIILLTRQNDQLTDEIRRSNLLIHGLPEDERNEKDLEKSILSLLKSNLGFDVQIDAPYRLGKTRTPGKPRPVKVRFPFFSQRSAVLKIRKQFKLPGFKILITEDLTTTTRAERQRKWLEKNPDHPTSGRPWQTQ